MPVSTVRWDRDYQNVGRGAKARRKFVVNRPRNWLLALYFLACVKRSAGKAMCGDSELPSRGTGSRREPRLFVHEEQHSIHARGLREPSSRPEILGHKDP